MVKANADVKGLTYCVLQCLQLAGLHESLALYPEFAPRFSRGLRGELSYNLGAGGGPAEVRALGLCVGGLEAWGVGQRGGPWGCCVSACPGVSTTCMMVPHSPTPSLPHTGP